MKIEILYMDGCPNYQPTVDLLAKILRDMRIRISIEKVLVETEEEALRERFLGSPSIRFDGRDIDPDAESQTDYGLKCRIYAETGEGIPSEESIRLVLEEAQKKRRLQKEAPLN